MYLDDHNIYVEIYIEIHVNINVIFIKDEAALLSLFRFFAKYFNVDTRSRVRTLINLTTLMNKI